MHLPTMIVAALCAFSGASAWTLPCIGQHCARSPRPATTTTTSAPTPTSTIFNLQIVGGGPFNGQYLDLGYQEPNFLAIVEPGLEYAATYSLSSTGQLLLSGAPTTQHNTTANGDYLYFFSPGSNVYPITCTRVHNPVDPPHDILLCRGVRPSWLLTQACNTTSGGFYPQFFIGNVLQKGCYLATLKVIPYAGT